MPTIMAALAIMEVNRTYDGSGHLMTKSLERRHIISLVSLPLHWEEKDPPDGCLFCVPVCGCLSKYVHKYMKARGQG